MLLWNIWNINWNNDLLIDSVYLLRADSSLIFSDFAKSIKFRVPVDFILGESRLNGFLRPGGILRICKKIKINF